MMEAVDVLLINSPSPNPGSILSHRIQGLLPLGIGYIATVLNQNSFNAKLMDFYLKTVTRVTLLNFIEKHHPKIIGISTTTETYKNGLRLAEIIKSVASDTFVVMGGYHVTFEFEHALNTGFIDCIVRGEGEMTFLELCKYIINGEGKLEGIDGISYRKDNVVKSNADRKFICDLDKLPFPDRSLYDLKSYSVPCSISTSRGCPGRCIFCAAAGLSGGKYRIRSAGNVVEELEYLKGLGFDRVQIIDDTMTANLRRLNEFLILMKEKALGMHWACESRVDVVTKELLQRMYDAGCRSLQFGVEAGNQEMLDCLKKHITLEQIRNVFRWCNEIGIRAASCLIIGQPFDTPETIKQTIQIGLELQKMGAQIVFSISTPYPGTYMYNNTDEFGLEIIDFDTDNYTTQKAVYNTKNLSSIDIQNYFFDACISVGRTLTNNNLKEKYKLIREEAMQNTPYNN
ncbi:MAG: radical SAM protein [Mobilitalea sp.]